MRRETTTRAMVAACLAASLAVLLTACAPGPGRMAAGGEAPGDGVAPTFTLASLSGESVSLSDFAGDVVLIDFWATWCGPCHHQADILHELWEEFEGKGVQFLAISLGEPEDVVRSFVDENPYPYPVLVDPEDLLSPELGIYVLPTIMVVDPEGNVSFLQPGVSQADALRRALYEAGVEHPATTAG